MRRANKNSGMLELNELGRGLFDFLRSYNSKEVSTLILSIFVEWGYLLVKTKQTADSRHVSEIFLKIFRSDFSMSKKKSECI